MQKFHWSQVSLVCIGLALVGIMFGCSTAPVMERPSLRVVVLIDRSDTYKSRQAQAVEFATQLLGEMAEERLHRWEGGNDQIAVISIDSSPDVLWEGSFPELQNMDAAEWETRFRARSDYAGCTDLSMAFATAARYLEGDPRFVGKYLVVFSDLIDEPPTDSISRCKPARSMPGEDFPWARSRIPRSRCSGCPPTRKLFGAGKRWKWGLNPTSASIPSRSRPRFPSRLRRARRLN